MNEKLLKWLIYLAGLVCLLVFVSVRFEPMFNGILQEDVEEGYWDRTEYGELYYFSMIKHFREEGLPPAGDKFEHSPRQASPEESEILCFGDSFFEFSRLKQFSERLADDFGKRVHTVNEDHPLKYLASMGYRDTVPKLLIYERTERYIPISFEQEHHPETTGAPVGSVEPGLLAEARNIIFYEPGEELYNVMLKRSYLTTGIYSLFSTLKFDLFGHISSFTPVYHRNGEENWLFYHDQVNGEKTSFYYPHTPEEINRICDHMADLSEKLKQQYNITLVYLPMPAKYTVYHSLVNNDSYNGFLPSLYEGLEQRGVPCINIYEDYISSADTLYYRTDSHWNQLGMDVAYNKSINYIENSGELARFLAPESTP